MKKLTKEFLLKDVAKLEYGNKFDKNKMTHNSPCYNFVSRTATNNGISDFVDDNGTDPYPSGSITLAFGGSIGSTFIQPQPFYTGQNVGVITLPKKVSEKAKIYFITTLAKTCKNKYVAFADEINKHFKTDLSLHLPVIESSEPEHEYTPDDIDWNYMQERIKELEQERIKELEQERIKELDAYLKASGLNDYELTDEDKEVLSLSTKCTSDEANALAANCKNGKIIFKEFQLKKLFVASTGDVDLQKRDLNGKGQYLVNSGIENKGIKGKTDKIAKIFPANTITIDFWGNAYYRDFEYKMATHNHVFSLSGDVIKNKYVGIYIVGLLSEFPKLFSYDNMATWNKLKELEIELPVTDYGDKDYDYMERYIRAVEKVVIKEVVEFKDKWIETTKKVVARE